MKWVTWEQVGVDRMACAWLILKYLDPDAEFLFIPTGQNHHLMRKKGANDGKQMARKAQWKPGMGKACASQRKANTTRETQIKRSGYDRNHCE